MTNMFGSRLPSILIILGSLEGLHGQGKYTNPDAPETERAAREALSRAKILDIIGITRDLSTMIRDLGAKVTDIAIGVEIPSDVLFEFDKSEIRPAAVPMLAKIAELIKAHPGTPVQIDGHTDALGSDAHNFPLSQHRAASVKKWLAANGGIEVARMATQGWGKTKPVAPNTKPDGSDNPEGRQKSRRVEITIKTK
jgi:photosystem I P700 chlorophyll a apoprotein A2